MVRTLYSKFFLLLCFLLNATFVVSKQSHKKSEKTKETFTLKTEDFLISREFLEAFCINHPLMTAGFVTTSLGSALYPEYAQSLKNFIQEHRSIFFCGGCVAILCAYWNRKKIANYLKPEEEVNQEENSEKSYFNFFQAGVKIYGPGEIETTFQDVAGLQTAKEELSDILLFLQDSRKFEEIGARVPKGILLSGEPGNGKTLLARALAGEVSCPFLYITASQFIEAIVGVGAARIRDLFSVAKDLAPCIIFIDEIDAIGRKRSSASYNGGDSELTQSLNQLLAEMDGFEQQENPIIVIGATNRVDVLDEALLRPGRFDRKIEINAPYIKDRYEILAVHFKKVQTGFDIDLEKIACGTVGFSGADLANLVNEAAILAVRDGRSFVQMRDVDKARDIILLGRETKGMDISDEEMFKTAVHESGHALARVFQSNATPLYKVSIVPRAGALGITFGMDSKEQYSKEEEELRAEIVVALAGSVAEEIILARRGVGARSDLQKARELATAMVMWYGMTEEFKDVTFVEFIHSQVHLPDAIATKLHQEVAKIIHDCRLIAYQIISDHKKELLELSDLLLDQGTVGGEDVYNLCEVPLPELQFCLDM